VDDLRFSVHEELDIIDKTKYKSCGFDVKVVSALRDVTVHGFSTMVT
jgi:hypothetical protein